MLTTPFDLQVLGTVLLDAVLRGSALIG